MRVTNGSIHAVLFVGALCLGLVLEAHGQERRLSVGFVDMETIFSEYHKTRIADGQLRAQAEEFNQERQALIAELREAEASFQQLREEAQDVTLSEEARDRRRMQAEEQLVAIRDMEERVQRFDQLRSKQLEDQGRRMRRGLVRDIREVIRTHARDRGLDAVIDSSGQSASGIEVLLYVDSRVDLTEEVLAILNRDAAADED